MAGQIAPRLEGLTVVDPRLVNAAGNSAQASASQASRMAGDTFSAQGMSAVQRSRALASTASQVGNTLKQANKLQEDAEKIWGTTKAYQAIAGNQASARLIAGTRAVMPATSLALVFTDLAKAQETAANDLTHLSRMLADPSATTGLKVVAGAKAIQSASFFVTKQNLLMNSLSDADRAYLQQSSLYGRLTSPARPAMQVLGKVQGSYLAPVIKVASVVGASAGVVVGVLALPSLLKGTATAGRKFAGLIDDPTATEDQKLDALADTTRGSAAVVYAANGIRSGAQMLAGFASEARIIGPLVMAASASPVAHAAGSVLGTAFKVLLPFADASMLVADAIKFKHVMSDPNAKALDKGKALLAVGLDGLKVATYILPQTIGLRIAYMAASFGQMGLATMDLGHTLMPTLKKAGNAIVDAALHPKEGFEKAKAAVGRGASWIGQSVTTLGAKVLSIVANPGASAANGKLWVSSTMGGFKDVVHEARHVIEVSAGLLDRWVGERISEVRGAIGDGPAAPGLPPGTVPTAPGLPSGTVQTAPQFSAPKRAIPSLRPIAPVFVPAPGAPRASAPAQPNAAAKALAAAGF